MYFIKQIRLIWSLIEGFISLRWVQILLSGIVIMVTLICLIQPEISGMKWISHQTVLILFVWLGGGITFLMLRSKRLAFVCLLSCAALCLYLKNASNISLAASDVVINNDLRFSICHFNLSSIQDNFEDDLDLIDSLRCQILVFQEFTPQFRDQVMDRFDSLYSDHIEFLRMDDYGQVVFTTFPVLAKDTFLIYNIPVLRMVLEMQDGRSLQLISHFNLPPITAQYKEDSQLVFSQLGDYIDQTEGPVIYLGTLNYVSWDTQLIKFRFNTGLNDSRKSFFPSFSNSKNSLFYAPVDHIYYNDYLDCLQFKKIDNDINKTIGIRGEYQLNNNDKLYTSTDKAN